jgi:hypothetical protein
MIENPDQESQATAPSADEAIERAFEAIQHYQWGADPSPLAPIDNAVYASQQGMSEKLELRLASLLNSSIPHAGKGFVCRKLAIIGTAKSVPFLAAMLVDGDVSHMARYALERIPGTEADDALRDALPKVQGRQKVGVISSLGIRRDARSAAQLAALLGSAPEIAAAAAVALGRIGNPDAAKALAQYRMKAPKEYRAAAADASLTCAERLLADGNRSEAIAVLRSLNSQDQPEHVRQAAKLALSAATRV